MTGEPHRFPSALNAAMHEANVGAVEIARAVGVTDDAVRKWLKGKSTPGPEAVFEAERQLGVAPGELSRHLGYVPVASPASVVAAIEADPALDAAGRDYLLAMYRTARRLGSQGPDHA